MKSTNVILAYQHSNANEENFIYLYRIFGRGGSKNKNDMFEKYEGHIVRQKYVKRIFLTENIILFFLMMNQL